MAPPPAKRQKRAVVLSSEDEEGSMSSKKQTAKSDFENPPLPTRARKKPTSKTGNGPATNSKPTARKSRQEQKDVSSHRPISMFFDDAAKRQRYASHVPSEVRGSRVVQHLLEEPGDEDAIEDVSEIENGTELKARRDTTVSNLDRRKQAGEAKGSTANSTKPGRLLSGSVKFKLPISEKAHEGKAVKVNEVDQRPWAEKYAPSNLDELAVHRKKVFDVRVWLENVLSGKDRRRLLILKGPAGAGKTVTLKMLAQVMKFDLSEWKNPVISEYSSEAYMSVSANFEDFLGRSRNFNRLEIDGIPAGDHPAPSSDTERQKVILIEEFPISVLSQSTALHSFRSSILQHLVASTPSLGSVYPKDSSSPTNITPLVMIITETRLTSSSISNDTFTVHRLLGSDIISHPGVAMIEFNPIAATFIRKALSLVIQKEARHSGRRRIPGPSVLEKLGEVGDVRSAIGSLEFLCKRGQDDDDWGGRVAAYAKNGAKTTMAMTEMERNTLEVVSHRENSLGLFHAVGKIVYNKRDDFPTIAAGDVLKESPTQPPNHLHHHRRLRLPQTCVGQLVDETGTDPETFIAALHENYVMSCDGSSFLDALDGCLDALSDGDLIGISRGGKNRRVADSNTYGSTTESIRQDEMAFQLVVRGLLFALPDPVKRRKHPTGIPGRHGGKDDSHKMFYPMSMKLSRQMEDVEHSIDQCQRRLQNTTASASNFMSSRCRIPKPTSPSKRRPQIDKEQVSDGDCVEPFRTSLNCTRVELILERLPYITKIERARISLDDLRELENLTQFHGIDVPDRDESEDENADDRAFAAAQKTAAPALRKTEDTDKEAFKGMTPVEEQVEKLYLSDDDIED